MLKECRCSVPAECAFELNLVDLVTEKVGVKIFTDWYLPASPKDIVHYLQPTSGIQVCSNTNVDVEASTEVGIQHVIRGLLKK